MNFVTNPAFLTIAVGERSPFPALPAGQLTVMVSFAQSNPVMVVSLPDVNDEDIANFKAPPQAVALRRSAAMPAGALLVVLKTSDEDVWPICAPLLDERPVMQAWARARSESNIVVLVLVDADTKIVRAQRTIGLPPTLLDMVRQGFLQGGRIDESAALEELAGLSDGEIWKQSTCWSDQGDDVFTMVAAAPVQP